MDPAGSKPKHPRAWTRPASLQIGAALTAGMLLVPTAGCGRGPNAPHGPHEPDELVEAASMSFLSWSEHDESRRLMVAINLPRGVASNVACVATGLKDSRGKEFEGVVTDVAGIREPPRLRTTETQEVHRLSMALMGARGSGIASGVVSGSGAFAIGAALPAGGYTLEIRIPLFLPKSSGVSCDTLDPDDFELRYYVDFEVLDSWEVGQWSMRRASPTDPDWRRTRMFRPGITPIAHECCAEGN